MLAATRRRWRCSTPPSTTPCRSAPTSTRSPTASTSATASAATAFTAPRTATSRRRYRAAQRPPRRARTAPRSPAPRQRLLGLRHRGGRVGGHLDGLHAARGAGDGHALAATSIRRPCCTSSPRRKAVRRRGRARCSTSSQRPARPLRAVRRHARAARRPRSTATAARGSRSSSSATALRKYIGAYLAALGGADAVVFAGGIGENAPAVASGRWPASTLSGSPRSGAQRQSPGREAEISPDGAQDARLRDPTNEELMIARDAFQIVGKPPVVESSVERGFE